MNVGSGPLPKRLVELLERPNPAVIASIRPDGSPHTSATWYAWNGGRVLLNMEAGRARLRFMRRNPAVSLTGLNGSDWFQHVSLFGRIVEFTDDEGLAGIDRLAQRYLGRAYPKRDRPRVNAWMEIERWYAWNAHAEVSGLGDAGSLRG
jgi:PPOX class probable F420-dependent enzyme